MKLSEKEVGNILVRCAGLSSIACVYDELLAQHPALSPDEAREAFLSLLSELMVQGHLRFLGETQVFRGEDVPRKEGVLRFDLMPNRDLSKIILEGKFWEATEEQRRQIFERLMFDSEVFSPADVLVGGLRQPSDQRPQAIVNLIRSKWPPELQPRRRKGEAGFDPLWFEKWSFAWVDVDV